MGTHQAVLTCTHNPCFEQKQEKYQIFSAENFQFLKLKKYLLISEFTVPLDLLIFVLHSIRSGFTRTIFSFSATYFDRKTAIRFI